MPNVGVGTGSGLAAIVAMRQEGQTYDEIGRGLGVSRERVRQLLAKVGANGRLPKPCLFPGCLAKRCSRVGYCIRHQAKKWHQPESWLPGVPFRISQHIHPEPMSGCWLWGGYVNEVLGYGVACYRLPGARRAKTTSVHRIVYALLSRPDLAAISRKTLHVHHLCGVKVCCNPDHLQLVTASAHASEHRRREWAEGRGWGSPEAQAKNKANMRQTLAARQRSAV